MKEKTKTELGNEDERNSFLESGITQEIIRICNGRAQDYGEATKSFSAHADYLNLMTKLKLQKLNIKVPKDLFSPEDIAMLYMNFKQARHFTGSGRVYDNFVDMTNYARLAGDLYAETEAHINQLTKKSDEAKEEDSYKMRLNNVKPANKFCGVFSETAEYMPGDVVLHALDDGKKNKALYVCRIDTSEFKLKRAGAPSLNINEKIAPGKSPYWRELENPKLV